jgi:hypothetical protein
MNTHDKRQDKEHISKKQRILGNKGMVQPCFRCLKWGCWSKWSCYFLFYSKVESGRAMLASSERIEPIISQMKWWRRRDISLSKCCSHSRLETTKAVGPLSGKSQHKWEITKERGITEAMMMCRFVIGNSLLGLGSRWNSDENTSYRRDRSWYERVWIEFCLVHQLFHNNGCNWFVIISLI